MKLVVNMVMGSFMAASAEGLELAKGVGLRDEHVIEVVNMAAIATPMFKLKVGAPPIESKDVVWRVKQGQKVACRVHTSRRALSTYAPAEGSCAWH